MVRATSQKESQTPSQSKKREGFFFQAKPTINQPNDMYEQEADAVADKVMRMPQRSPFLGDNKPFFSPPTININKANTAKEDPLKKENKEEETEETLPEIQAKLSFDSLSTLPDYNKANITGLIQRKCAHCEEEEKKMQRKEMNNSETVADTSTENYINSLNGKGRSLTQQERKFFEPRMGYDFSNVQLHTNSEANQSAKSINALAYTRGNNIVFGSGQYQQNTDEGKKLLAHELTHVAQQSGSAPTVQKQPIEGSGARVPIASGPEQRVPIASGPEKRGADARREYIERGQRVAPKDATLILPEDFGDYHPINDRTIYPEIRAGNASGDIEIIGIDGGLVIFCLLKTFYYEMGVDAFHRNIGAAGMVASGVWEGSKGVLYAGAWAAQKAGQIGQLLPVPPTANVAFRGLEKAGSEGLEELDRMEAVRQGYIPHEKTQLEKLEEGSHYLDPSGLQPEFKIPGGHEAPAPSEHKSVAPSVHPKTLHEEGGSPKVSLETGHGEAGGEKPAAKAGPETVKKNVVHESAKQSDSEVKLEDGTHGVAAYGEGKEAGFEFCSNGCDRVARKLKVILDGLPENYDFQMVRNLRHLYLRIGGVEKELVSGRIKKPEANRFAREVAKELNTYVNQDVYLDKLLQQSAKQLQVNRAQVSQGAGTQQQKPGISGRRLERNYRIEGDRDDINFSRRGYQVYEYNNKQGELLYVGMSGGAKTQQDWLDRFWKDHVKTEWIGEAETVSVRPLLNEQDALALEETLIPIAKYNKQKGVHSSRFPEGGTSSIAAKASKRKPFRFKIKVVF